MPRPFARLPVLGTAAAVAAVLLALSPRYGYHRDELYFRLLGGHPAWGYVDQPPLTPLLARGSALVFGDTPTGLRIPAIAALALFTVLLALITRELGGGRAAQILAAVGASVAGYPMLNGHTLLTSSADLVFWSAAILCALRALRGGDGRWWLAFGAVTGAATFNKHLIALLVIGLAAGLLLAGPRTVLRSPWLWAGAALGVLVGSPNLLYQVSHGWPQLTMAAAIGEEDEALLRLFFLPLQVVLIGVPLFGVAVVGWLRVWRDRPVRALAVAYPVAAAVVIAAGGRYDYVFGLVALYYAAGWVDVERWCAARRPVRMWGVATAVAVNAVVSAVLALPVLPARALAATPVITLNEVSRESVGWPEFAAQVRSVYRDLPAAERERAVVFASNYGEAGALDRFGGGLPPVYSGHNELHRFGPPPESATVAVAVGSHADALRPGFARCADAGRITVPYGVRNEEHGQPVLVCRDRSQPWRSLWPDLRDYG